MPAARWLVAPLAAIILATSAPAFAQPPAPQPTVSVALALRPTSQRVLDDLAQAHGVSRHLRAALVAALVPDRSRHQAIADIAQRLGLKVTATGSWTVRVAGPAARVQALFGQASRTPGGLMHAYARVPTPLASYVVAALPTTGHVARPLAITSGYQGGDFRTAYSAPDGQPASGGQPLTIATIQLSGWDDGDLRNYAAAAGLPDPVASGQYAAVRVDGADPSVPDGSGDKEVALDQEAILSTAPHANQRAYFAPNGGAGFFDAINRVAKDAGANRIAALSVSWGGCEFVDPNNPRPDRAFYAAMDQALKYAVAAGVTVFSATGDFGSADCIGQVSGRKQYDAAVDYPASSPYVVGVGGTTLANPANPATATAWPGSGGGESTVERLPAFQSSLRSRSASGGRLVPDISSFADVDKNTGRGFYMVSGGQWLFAGGTSLGAPTQASLFANVLMVGGYQGGIGDIHDAIYDAHAAAFTDVTRGNNRVCTQTRCVGYYATPGYDKVSGRGTPVWSTLVSSLGDFLLHAPSVSARPTVALRATLPSGLTYRGWALPSVDTLPSCDAATPSPPTSVTMPAVEGWHTVYLAGLDESIANNGAGTCHIVGTRVLLDRQRPTVRVRTAIAQAGRAWATWSAADPAPSSGLLHYVVRITDAHGVVWSARTRKTSHAFATTGAPAYAVSVTAVDRAGNKATEVARVLDDTSGALRYSASWRTEREPAAFLGTVHSSARAGQAMRVTAAANRYVLYVTTCPTCGTVGVYDGDGHLVRRIDTYSAVTRYRRAFVISSATTTLRRTFTIRVLHRHSPRSGGYDVRVDGVSTGA